MAEEKEKQENKEKQKPKKAEKLERIPTDKIRGRVIIFDPENSEFSKNLELDKRGDYTQKNK